MDDDIGLPKATVNKIVKEVLADMRIAAEARDLICECGTEFLHMLTAEANEVNMKRNKKMMMPDDIATALENLGVPEFKEAAETVAVQFKTDAKASRKKKKEKSLAAQGIPMEELQRQQEALFAQAREDYETVLADQGVEEDKEDEPEFTLDMEDFE